MAHRTRWSLDASVTDAWARHYDQNSFDKTPSEGDPSGRGAAIVGQGKIQLHHSNPGENRSYIVARIAC